MPQTLAPGTDVTSLMPGQDVTDLIKSGTPPPPSPAPAEESPSWLGSAVKFAEGVGSQINPVEIAKGIFGAITSPIQTVKGLTEAQIDQFKKGKDLYDQGRYTEAVGHALAGALPLVGPAAANIGEDIGAGNVAHGLGAATGLVGTVLAPGAVKPAAEAVAGTGLAESAANMADRGVRSRMVDVMAPKVGPNKMRFGTMAEQVAPAVAAEPGLGALSRTGLTEKISARLDEAESALDEAAQARNPGAAYPTGPIVKALREAKAELEAPAVQGSMPTPAMTGSSPSGLIKMPQAVPLGRDVLPSPNATRAAQIDKAIAEVKALGPIARYDSLKTIRQAYDQIAKVKYAPSMTADFLTKAGEASGAADVTSALREALAQFDPGTAAANKDYAVWRKANDVMRATAEVERTRPTVGRTIASRLGGTIAGGAIGGTMGEIVGFTVAPLLDSMASAANVGRKIMVARTLSSISTALKSGDVAAIENALRRARAISLVTQAAGKAQ